MLISDQVTNIPPRDYEDHAISLVLQSVFTPHHVTKRTTPALPFVLRSIFTPHHVTNIPPRDYENHALPLVLQSVFTPPPRD